MSEYTIEQLKKIIEEKDEKIRQLQNKNYLPLPKNLIKPSQSSFGIFNINKLCQSVIYW